MDFGIQSSSPQRSYVLVPILLGLVAPVFVLWVVDARALLNATVIFNIYLYALFIIAAGAYIFSVLFPGEITHAGIDRNARVVTLERAGLLARSTVIIPFADISTIGMDITADADGYETATPVIELTSGETVPLPAGTTEFDMATMRAMLKRR